MGGGEGGAWGGVAGSTVHLLSEQVFPSSRNDLYIHGPPRREPQL